MLRGVAQPGSAPAWGAGGREFKSLRPDQFFTGFRKARVSQGLGPFCFFFPVRASCCASRQAANAALRARPLLFEGDRSVALRNRLIRSGCPDGSRLKPGLARRTFEGSPHESITADRPCRFPFSVCLRSRVWRTISRQQQHASGSAHHDRRLMLRVLGSVSGCLALAAL